MSTTIQKSQRFTKERTCPICNGWDTAPRGSGERCHGYMGSDGTYAHCSREEHAGGLPQEPLETYAHRLEGPCKCGETHGAAPIVEHAKPANGTNGKHHFREVAQWEYEGGLVVVRGVEDGEKTYRQKHRVNGHLKWGGIPGPQPLYRAPELRTATSSQFIWLVEGEKCADALRAAGFVATTSPGGASQWGRAAENAVGLLAKHHVVILPDNDAPGRRYAADAVATLAPVTASLRVLALPGLGEGEDVADWLARGGDPEELVRLAEATADISTKDTAGITWISTTSIFEPLPPTKWLSRELGICPGRPTMIAGYGYSGKTLAGQSLMLAFTAGLPAWGHFPAAAPMRARHLDFEQGRHATLKRYQRLAEGMELCPADIAPRLEVAIFPPAMLNASDAYDVYCRASEGCQILLVDSFAGATPGGVENDAAMRSHVDTLTRVSETTGATFTLIHHAGKPKESHIADARVLIRGSSAIFDACGSVLVFVGDKSGPVRVQQVKAPAEAEGQAIAPFCLHIEDVPASAGYRDGVRVAYQAAEDKAAEDKADRESSAERRKAAYLARIERAVPEKMEQIWTALRRVKGHSITSRTILESLVVGDTTVKQAAVTRLLADGRVQRVKGDKERWFEAV